MWFPSFIKTTNSGLLSRSAALARSMFQSKTFPRGHSRRSFLVSGVSSAVFIIASSAKQLKWEDGLVWWWREQPPLPLCLALGRSAGYCSPSAAVFVTASVLIVCLGSYHWLYPAVMRQDRSLCQHSQHRQPRMRSVSSSLLLSSTVSCSAQVDVNSA